MDLQSLRIFISVATVRCVNRKSIFSVTLSIKSSAWSTTQCSSEQQKCPSLRNTILLDIVYEIKELYREGFSCLK